LKVESLDRTLWRTDFEKTMDLWSDGLQSEWVCEY